MRMVSVLWGRAGTYALVSRMQKFLHCVKPAKTRKGQRLTSRLNPVPITDAHRHVPMRWLLLGCRVW